MYKTSRHILLLLFTLVTLHAQGLQHVTLQLNWLDQFQFAGFYVAKEHGFYEKAGLDVTIKELTLDTHVVDDVLSGAAEFGVGRSSLLIDHTYGLPVVALGAIFQHSPSVLITTDPKIISPKDLRGKRIMATAGQSTSASFMAMLLSEGVRLDEVKIQKHSFILQDLIDGKTDAMSCYLSNEPYQLQQKGVDFHVLDPADYGNTYYGDILFTSRGEIERFPQRTKAFYDASIKGWQWALSHIEETAKLIFDDYNTQDKTLESLVFEGEVLKKLAFDSHGEFGHISFEKMRTIQRVYQLAKLTGEVDDDLEKFIDPLGFNRTRLRLGVLAKRGNEETLRRWSPLAEYLNRVLSDEHIEIVPIPFDGLKSSIASKEVDFLLSNPVNYVNMAYHHGVSRIATLNNRGLHDTQGLKQFGSVLFKRKSSPAPTDLDSLVGSKIAAVDPSSFGGWVMAYDLLKAYGIHKDDLRLSFLGTHDAVVKAVLRGDADVGIIRTDTLEHMHKEGVIRLDDIAIVHPVDHADFPFLISTELYPEWPFSKLKHVSDKVADHILTALINMPHDSKEAIGASINGWSVPLEYTSVRAMLKRLRLPPFEHADFEIKDVLDAYGIWIVLMILSIVLMIGRYLYVRQMNRSLDLMVQERTAELSKANKELEKLAHTDVLTGIYNRRYLLEVAEKYFKVSKRNGTPFQVLTIDLDYFKHINDTYGHQTGDEVLRLFCENVQDLLRTSDLFGRMGGEEFIIFLQNTSLEGAEHFAQRLLETVRRLTYVDDRGRHVTFTISIGIAQLGSDDSLDALIQRSDQALYGAKNSGRDRAKTL